MTAMTRLPLERLHAGYIKPPHMTMKRSRQTVEFRIILALLLQIGGVQPPVLVKLRKALHSLAHASRERRHWKRPERGSNCGIVDLGRDAKRLVRARYPAT